MNDYATTLDRSRQPEPGPLPKISFPSFEGGSLSNGLDVWTVQNHEQPIVTLSLYVRAGSALDPKLREGLACSVTDLLTKGTSRRTATEIAEAIDFVGGSLSASASWDALTINVNVLSKYLDVALDLLGDIIQRSTFPEEELDRMRLQRLAGLKQAKADAGFLSEPTRKQGSSTRSLTARTIFPQANPRYGKNTPRLSRSIAGTRCSSSRFRFFAS